MRILTDCSFLSETQIKTIEDKFRARYVFESQLKLKSDRWSDFSAAVFYSDLPHPKGSHWFGIWLEDGKLIIGDAISATKEAFIGAVAESGDVIYSRNPHDYRESADRTVFIDGGREHCRHNLTHEILKLEVVKDKVSVVSEKRKIECCDVPYMEELNPDITAALLSRGHVPTSSNCAGF
jgi:hypothetical protein